MLFKIGIVTYFRLEPSTNQDEWKLVSDMFDGGERLNLTINSRAIPRNEEYCSRVLVKDVQSFSSGFLVSKIAMDAIQYLHGRRDQLLCDAHELVNNKLVGYVKRKSSIFPMSSLIDKLVTTTLSISDMLRDDEVVIFINNRSVKDSYRIVIPYLWEVKQEWILIIIDNFISTTHFIYTKYEDSSNYPSSNDERMAFNLSLEARIKSLLEAISVAHPRDHDLERETIAHTFAYQNPESHDTPSNCYRTPSGRSGMVKLSTDSGLYVSYAMECDYYDAPVFADENDWLCIRKHTAYSIPNQHLPFV